MATNVLNEKIIASGTGEGGVLIWERETVKENDEDQEVKKKKKRKLDVAELSLKKEIAGIHTMQVTDMQFVGMTQLLTGSYDHTVKLVDISKGVAVSSIHTSYAGVCSLDSTQNTVFAGLTDSTIRQWDIRESAQTKVYSDSHSGWVSSVAINPLNRNVLVSGGYEGYVLMWDIRGDKKPLQKVCVQKEKVMAVGWNGPQKIVSGGCEGQLYVHSLTFDETK